MQNSLWVYLTYLRKLNQSHRQEADEKPSEHELNFSQSVLDIVGPQTTL